MSRLDDFKKIADSQLDGVNMSPGLKQRVRDGIAAQSAKGRAGKAMPFPRRRLVATLGLAAACIALLFIVLPTLPGEPGLETTTPATAPATAPVTAASFAVTAQKDTPAGVQLSSGFVISTGGAKIEATQLRSAVKITPAIEYDIEEDAGDYVLLPSQPLQEGTVYRISLTALSGAGEAEPLEWAFQTERRLKVVSTFPADGYTWAAADSGIEIGLSDIVTDADKYFSISPKADGRLEYYDRTLVFIPNQPLACDTLYTVTLGAGFGGEGTGLADDYSFSFRTRSAEDGAEVLYLSGRFAESFIPGDPVVIEMLRSSYGANSDAAADVWVTAYRIPGDEEAYMNLYSQHYAYVHPTMGRSTDYIIGDDTISDFGLTEAFSLQTAAEAQGGRRYVILPGDMEQGFYLIEINIPDDSRFATRTVQKLVCISDFSVWSQSQNGQTLVWVNSASTGLPVEDAVVTLSDTWDKTSADGLVVLDNPYFTTNAASLIVKAVDGGGVWASPIPVEAESVPHANRLYQAALYFDRAAYLPTDTIRVWGVVAPRDEGTPLPQTLTITAGNIGQIVDVTIGADGTFTAVLTTQDQKMSYVPVQLRLGDDVLTSAYLTVVEYTKPAYTLDMSLDKTYYRGFETATAQITASFFDGTPAGGLAINAEDRYLTTDSAGNAAAVYGYSGPYVLASWAPESQYCSAQVAGQESTYIGTYAWALRFVTGYMQQIELENDAAGTRIVARANQIDFEKADRIFADGYSDYYSNQLYDDNMLADALRGPAYSQGVSVSVFENRRVVEAVETRYDFINKRTYEVYTYAYQRAEVNSFTFNTAGGFYDSGYLPYENTDDVYYTLIFSYTTPDNVQIYFQRTLPGWYQSYNDYFSYYLSAPRYSFAKGESLPLTVVGNGEAQAPQAPARVLWSVLRDGVLDAEVSPDAGFTVTCREEYIPSVYVQAAYFDGRHIYPVSGTHLHYDYEDDRLDIDIQTDLPGYAPGDEVTATVTVSDKEGNPVQASFVLSVVDEAAFAVMEQYTDVLAALYEPIYNLMPRTFASYVRYPSDIIGFAEGGGEGGGEGLRDTFADTAAFVTGTTDENGAATVTLTLPDNITSWRLTCVAVTKGVKAGMAQTPASATLPFFINAVYNEKYVYGDDVVISVRGAGTDADAAQAVDYTVTLISDGGEQRFDAEAPAGEYAYFSFGKLETGQYSVRIDASQGQHYDAVLYQFRVVGSLLEAPVTVRLDSPSGIEALTPERFPLTLTFNDKSLDFYLEALEYLSRASGENAPAALSRKAAAGLYGELGLEPYYDYQPALWGVQGAAGGIFPVQGAEADPRATALALAAWPQGIDSAAAVQYLYGILYDSASPASGVAAACMGLASRGEPVLLDIRRLLDNPTALTVDDKMLLVLGQALLGDTSGAAAWYKANIAPALTRTDTGLLMLKAQDPRFSCRDTAMAAAIAAACGIGDSAPLARWAMAAADQAYMPGLEILLTLSIRGRPEASGAQLGYSIDGSAVRVTLDAARPVHTIMLTRSQLESFSLGAVLGDVGVTASYVASASEALAKQSGDSQVSINKAYSQTETGLVEITLTVNVPQTDSDMTINRYMDGYTLTDALPSGLRYVSCKTVYDGGWYLSWQEGQKTGFQLSCWNYDGSYRRSFTITYYARVALPGEFIAEAAVASHNMSGKIASGGAGVFEAGK